jgi:3-hydroxyacyl-CoA dehydrogenase
MASEMKLVDFEKSDNIAWVLGNNPPVNAISLGVRSEIGEGVRRAMADDSVEAVVIMCRGTTFFAGADIKELGKPREAPLLRDILQIVEQCKKPVIAAVHGTAFGGGCEVALAAHFRIALDSAKFALPEVKLGLLPGAGGTQRLTRLVGPQKALEMVTLGKPVKAKEALELGILDSIVEGDLREAAAAFAKKVVQEKTPIIPVSERNEKVEAAKGKPEIFEEFRKTLAKTKRGFEAPLACVEAVEAAVNMPFMQGRDVEHELFRKLRRSDQFAAQRHNFFAERAVGKHPDVKKDTPELKVERVGIIGAGTMGGGIAMACVAAGLNVTLVEVKQDLLERGLGVIRKNYEVSAKKGKMTADQVEKNMSMIKGVLSLDDLADVDLVIEAVYESMDLKKQIFTKLDEVCKKDAILATNTSYLDVNEIAAMTSRPEQVVGLHFFSPANIMKLLEVVRGEKTALPVLKTALTFAKKIRKVAVVVGVCYGFAANRMYATRKREVDNLLMEGADIIQLDRVIYDFGFGIGPVALYDLVGNDLGWSPTQSSGSPVKDKLCENGRLGLKVGKGFYKYESGSRKPIPDPEVNALIQEVAKEQGIEQREISNEEMLERCLYPIINEGAKILEEGIAVRASDLDVIWVNGFGWPVYLGGPMFYADLVGLDKILAALLKYQKKYGDVWKPAPLLERLVSEGKKLSEV